MSKRKSVVWNGVQYRSIYAAAKATGIGKSTLEYRIKQGYTCDAEVGLKGWRRIVTWNGVQYPSISAAAKANFLTHAAMSIRLRNGYTCDEDLKR